MSYLEIRIVRQDNERKWVLLEKKDNNEDDDTNGGDSEEIIKVLGVKRSWMDRRQEIKKKWRRENW